MAIGKSVFEIAALESEKRSVATEENLAEIRIGPNVYTLWRRPEPAQFAMLSVRMQRGGEERFRGMDRFISAMVLTPEEAVEAGRLDADGVAYSERAEQGDRFEGADFLFELWEDGKLTEEQLARLAEVAMELHTGFPTESSSDSSPGETTSGTPSTAASRRNTSTRSSSRSDGSSA